MQTERHLIDQLETDDIDQARQMTGPQRLRAGGDLFDEACRWTLAGIRRQFPAITDEEALNELRRRLSAERAAQP